MSNAGRPQIKLSDLPDDWENKIIELSNEGASITEIACFLEISKNTLTALTERNPDFLIAIKRCKLLCETWWEKKGRTEMENKDFNSTLWYMNMRNRFGWADKQINENKNESTLNISVSKDLNSKLDDLVNGE